jgi:hypothetical protein
MMNWGNGHIIAWNDTISSSTTLITIWWLGLHARYLPRHFFRATQDTPRLGLRTNFHLQHHSGTWLIYLMQ